MQKTSIAISNIFKTTKILKLKAINLASKSFKYYKSILLYNILPKVAILNNKYYKLFYSSHLCPIYVIIKTQHKIT